MALILSHTNTEQDGCLLWHFVDNTGTYNVTTNVGGYGTPNLASSAVTSATLYILPYGYATGWTFTFTIVTNVITACSVTSPSAVVTIITTDLVNTIFPFTEATPFVINNEWFEGEADSEIASSTYYFEYNVTNGTDTYTSSADRVIVCQVCCCVRNAEADLDATDCECQNSKVESAMRGQIFLDSAIWAMEDGDVEKSYANLMFAKKLCEGNGCSNC